MADEKDSDGPQSVWQKLFSIGTFFISVPALGGAFSFWWHSPVLWWLSLGLGLFGVWISIGDATTARTAVGQGKLPSVRTLWAPVLAVLFVVCAAVMFAQDRYEIEIVRRAYKADFRNLDFDEPVVASKKFLPDAQAELTGDEVLRAAMDGWKNWMSIGSALHSTNSQTFYLECSRFEDDYGSFKAELSVDQRMKVDSAAAFLTSEEPASLIDRTVCPVYRQMQIDHLLNGSIAIHVKQPNRDERLIIFARLKEKPRRGDNDVIFPRASFRTSIC